MQHRALRAAGVGQRRAVQRSVVDTLAAQGPAALAEVDAYLMGAAGLKLALDQGFRIVAYSGDLWLYQLALREGLAAIRDHAGPAISPRPPGQPGLELA